MTDHKRMEVNRAYPGFRTCSKYVYPELRVPIDSKRIVYDGAVIGRDVVRMLFNVPVTAPGSMPRSWRSFMTRGMSISST
jgi:hypothetical protein